MARELYRMRTKVLFEIKTMNRIKVLNKCRRVTGRSADWIIYIMGSNKSLFVYLRNGAIGMTII